jgi:glucose-6-phosphate isomerase
MKSVHMNDLFKQNPNRKSDFSVAIDQLQFDYSKNRITDVTMAQLVQLAKEVNLPSAIHSLFGGRKSIPLKKELFCIPLYANLRIMEPK